MLPWCLSANTRLASPNRIGFERKEKQRETGVGGGVALWGVSKGGKKRTRMCEGERHRERKEREREIEGVNRKVDERKRMCGRKMQRGRKTRA